MESFEDDRLDTGRAGDTLSPIAPVQYGDVSRWPVIPMAKSTTGPFTTRANADGVS
jgi:nucleoid-associated protein YgaU